jgi:hypothetical protein
LGNTRVLNLWLEDMDGVIIEEVVDSALSGSEVFIWVFNNWLDEKGVKDKDLCKLNIEINNLNNRFK